MCQMIYMGLPITINFNEANMIVKKHSHTLVPSRMNNFELGNELYRWYTTTRSMCDCGTVIGSLENIAWEKSSTKSSGQFKKWKKKGWSEAKIQRALFSMEMDTKNKENSKTREVNSLMKQSVPEAQNWIDLMKVVKQYLIEKPLYLMLIWDNGDYRAFPRKEKSVFLEQLESEELLYWQEGIAYRCQ